MNFRLKEFCGNNNKIRYYIEYEFKDNNGEIKTFNNAEYFKIDINSDKFESIMSNVGGFCANVTTRLIEDKKLKDITKIALFCIPQEYNDFIFTFIYIDKNNKIQHIMYDNKYYDYEYFKNKFKDCIIESGFIYDLEDNDETFKNLFNEVCYNPSVKFKYIVNNRNVKFTDTFEIEDLNILNDRVKNKVLKLGARKIIFSFNVNPFRFINLEGKILLNNGNYLLNYQYKSGLSDKGEYYKLMKEKRDGDFEYDYIDDSIFTFNVSLSQKLFDKLKFSK